MCVRAPLLTFCLAALSGCTTSVLADPLSPAETASHIGKLVTVCGFVASTKYAPQSAGAPTFLDFGSAYPNAVFTALILGDDRSKFGEPEKTLRGKQVCVTGRIRLYAGTAQVIVTQPDQLYENGSARAVP
jgi:hypothetical protein